MAVKNKKPMAATSQQKKVAKVQPPPKKVSSEEEDPIDEDVSDEDSELGSDEELEMDSDELEMEEDVGAEGEEDEEDDDEEGEEEGSEVDGEAEENSDDDDDDDDEEDDDEDDDEEDDDDDAEDVPAAVVQASKKKQAVAPGKKLEKEPATDRPKGSKGPIYTPEQMAERNKRSVFVGHLRNGTGKEALLELFSKVGKVEDTRTFPQKGFGFVTFENEKPVEAALKMSGTLLKSRPIQVERVKNIGKGAEKRKREDEDKSSPAKKSKLSEKAKKDVPNKQQSPSNANLKNAAPKGKGSFDKKSSVKPGLKNKGKQPMKKKSN